MFAYCQNNPVINSDQNGHFILTCIIVGAVVGGVICGGYSAASQCAENGFSNINWGVVGVNFLTGAISGAFAATPITTLASVAINAGLGVANYAGEQAVKGEEITVKGVVINGIAGGIGGAISGSGLDCTKLTDSWKHAAKVIAKESTRENVKVATKRIAVQIAVKKSVLRQIGTTVVRFFGGVLGADAAKSKSGELFQ